MYVDASALVAIIVDEPEAEAFGMAIRDREPAGSPRPSRSTKRPLACFADSRLRRAAHSPAEVGLLKAASISVTPLSDRHADAALDAFARFGRGQHAGN